MDMEMPHHPRFGWFVLFTPGETANQRLAAALHCLSGGTSPKSGAHGCTIFALFGIDANAEASPVQLASWQRITDSIFTQYWH